MNERRARAGAGFRIVRLALALSASTWAGWAAGRTSGVAALMEDLTRDHRRLESAVQRMATADMAEPLAALDRIYGALRDAYEPFYGGTLERWRADCDESRAVVRDLREMAALGFDDEQGPRILRERFHRLAEIRERSHDAFRPGLWRRLFGRKSETPIGSDRDENRRQE